jgi:phage-related protein
MAGTSRALTLKLLADIDNFTKGLNQADNEAQSFGDKIAGFGKKVGLAFAAAGAAAAAYAGKLAIDGVKSAIEDEAAQAKLATTLKNVTGATDAQVASTEAYIQKQQFAYGLTDTQLRPSLERLTRATKDITKAQELQSLAIDVAAGTGKDLEAVSNALGKAYEGNTTALGKLGLGIDKAALKSMSFDEITGKLSTTFKDQASIQADTYAGKMARLNQVVTEGKETVGVYILNAITPMVDTIINRVVPAIQDFTTNLGDKLAPIIKIFQPILEGLTTAFDLVRDSLESNNGKLQPFYEFIKNIAGFVVKYLAPAISETLGGAFKVVGFIISNLISLFATFVDRITSIYNTIIKIVNFVKGLGGKFADMLGIGGVTVNQAPVAPYLPMLTQSAYTAPASNIISLTVNGAIDPEGTARTIIDVLNQSSYRGTLGSAALV